ncbi:MAG: sensor histidine kinase [Desulfomonilaceae bacterium]
MTIERRVQITAGVLVLFVLGTVLLIFWSSRQVERGLRVSESVSQLIRYSYMLSTLLNEYQDHGNIRALDQREKNRELLGQTLNEMESEYRSIAPQLQESVQNAFDAVNSLSPQIPRLAALKPRDSQIQRARDMLASLMFLRLEQLLKGANDLNRVVQATVLERRHLVEKIVVSGGISLLVIVLANIYLIRKSVVQPLKELSAGAERIGAGNFDYVAETKHDDEVGRLALAFNSMIGRLRDDAITVKESEERLRHALEVGQLGSWGLNVKTGSAWRTLRHDRIFGYQEMLPEWTYRMFLDHVLPEDVKEVDDKFNEALRTQTEWNFECRIRRADGVERWIRAQGLPQFDDRNELTEMVGLVQDISDRKRAEEALKKAHDELELRVQERTAELTRSNEDLQQFAYVASHDLQEPLRNVANCLQMLEQDYKNKLDATADQYIHYAVESSVRMKDLINDLLAYSRVATKGKPPRQIDCEKILERALINLNSAITEAGAVITHDALPTTSADDTQLLQVFQNLIGNAIKFRRDEPPQIHVSAVKDKKEWIFSVKDNGIGIQSQHLDRIFVIFQRLHKRSEYDGTGMGLAIVKKIVERHGGRIWAESEPGTGTTFYFTIPDKGIQA